MLKNEKTSKLPLKQFTEFVQTRFPNIFSSASKSVVESETYTGKVTPMEIVLAISVLNPRIFSLISEAFHLEYGINDDTRLF